MNEKPNWCYFIVVIHFLAILMLGCKSPETNKDDVNLAQPELVKDVAESIERCLIEAFWNATDRSLRENTPLNGQTSKLEEFKAEHVCKIYSLHEKISREPAKAIFRITIPEIKGAFYEFTFEFIDGNWKSVDGRTKVGTQEFNYFAGKFLGKKSLKPYLDSELIKLGVPMVE